MSKISTNNALAYIHLFLDEQIHSSLFASLPVPGSDINAKVMTIMQALIKLERIIDPEEIFAVSKNQEILARYMGICNERDRKKLALQNANLHKSLDFVPEGLQE